MNYLEQILAFERKVETDYLPGTSQLLWYKLMLINNRCGWTEWFAVNNLRLMALVDIKKESTLIKYRDILIQKGYIKYKKGRKNKPSKYSIITSENKYLLHFLDQKGDKKSIKNVPQTATQTDQKRADINKQKQKQKQKKKEKNIIKKESFAEFVTLTVEEHEKLVAEYGENAVKCMINILDNYKGQNGKNYKSDYRAILNWVVKRAKEDYPREFMRKSNRNNYDDLPF